MEPIQTSHTSPLISTTNNNQEVTAQPVFTQVFFNLSIDGIELRGIWLSYYDFRAVSSLKLYGDHSFESYFFCILNRTFLSLHLKELNFILNRSSVFATVFVAMFHNLEPLYMKSSDGEGKTIRVPLFLCESFISSWSRVGTLNFKIFKISRHT